MISWLRKILFCLFSFCYLSESYSKVCSKPVYTVCSITINTQHEIQTLRKFLTDSIDGTISKDGCITFHEFVTNGEVSSTLLIGSPGTLNNPPTNCSVLMISGHHDMEDASCENSGICKRRNNLIYSNQLYEHELNLLLPKGPLLNLHQLVKTQAVCPEYGSMRGIRPKSGEMLLGQDLLATFLFACNLFRYDSDENLTASRYLLNPEKFDGVTGQLSFQQRTSFLFHNSALIFGFDSKAPTGGGHSTHYF